MRNLVDILIPRFMDYLSEAQPVFPTCIKHRYQHVKPVTEKDIGKSYNKRGRKTYAEHGSKEAARAAKRIAAQ